MNNFSLNILTFPLWWYTVGTVIVWQWAKRKIRFGLNKTGLLLFARHWREPLYGDYTRAGIVFSFFIRIFLLIFKALAFAIRCILIAAAGLSYLLLLPAVLIMVIFQLFPQ